MARACIAVAVTSILLAGAWQTAETDCLPCPSCAEVEPGTYYLLVCPAGDGDRLDDAGATIFVTLTDETGVPAASVPAEDIRLTACDETLVLCGGPVGGAVADGATNADGQTTIGGPVAAGGHGSGVGVYATIPPHGWLPAACLFDICVPITIASPDINADLVVDLVDIAIFSPVYVSHGYDEAMDYKHDGIIDIADFARFAQHYLHECD